jgi:ribonuclease P protein subunit RPR2
MTKREWHQEKKAERKKIALERAERLLELADEAFRERPELSHRYAELAWKLKTRYRLRLPPRLKRKICRKCRAFWVPGATCRVRTRAKREHVVITCLRCGYQRRVPYRPRKSK